MNDTQKMIVMDLAEHPDSSIGEIAERVFFSFWTVRRHLIQLKPLLIVTKTKCHNAGSVRGSSPVRYSLRDGVVNWCPYCGHIMERVRP